MRPRSFFAISPLTMLPLRGLRRTSLLTILLLVSCTPANTSAPEQPEVPPQATASVVIELPAPVEEESSPSVAEPIPTESPAEVSQPVATSRGPDLEATDPDTVSLASGELQLVEFFRYT